MGMRRSWVQSPPGVFIFVIGQPELPPSKCCGESSEPRCIAVVLLRLWDCLCPWFRGIACNPWIPGRRRQLGSAAALGRPCLASQRETLALPLLLVAAACL